MTSLHPNIQGPSVFPHPRSKRELAGDWTNFALDWDVGGDVVNNLIRT